MKNLNYNCAAQSFTQFQKKTVQEEHTGGSRS